MAAETVRIATYNVELSRKGPGLLLRDIEKPDPQVTAVIAVILQINSDILLVQSFDYDYDLMALGAFRDALATAGVVYPHIYARRPNSGMPSGADLDGDGALGDPHDAQSYGMFSGQGGMALLSRFPVEHTTALDLSALLWIDFPGGVGPKRRLVLPAPIARVQRLSSVGHWVMPVATPWGRLTLMGFHANTPVFDGPEDRNGLRNADELRLWQAYLDGAFGPPPQEKFVILGDANNDPTQGEGRKPELLGLLDDPRLQDVVPTSQTQGAATVHWPKVGRMRVDYVLPSTDLRVSAAGVFWPLPPDPMAPVAAAASRHRLVWVDLDIGPD